MSAGPRPEPPRREAQEPRPHFLRRRRAEAAAALVPLAALLGLMPPFVWVFAHDGRVFGAPAILVFLLLLWLGVILATRRLARRLLRPELPPPDAEG